MNEYLTRAALKIAGYETRVYAHDKRRIELRIWRPDGLVQPPDGDPRPAVGFSLIGTRRAAWDQIANWLASKLREGDLQAIPCRACQGNHHIQDCGEIGNLLHAKESGR